MAKLPPEVKTARAIKVFEKAGFVRQGRKSGTSHEVLKRPGPNGTITVRHSTMRIGLLRSLLRAAAMSRDEFLKNY
jgi:predicted RNA binding protein YcfA (HicA-like mRNA interferase family)